MEAQVIGFNPERGGLWEHRTLLRTRPVTGSCSGCGRCSLNQCTQPRRGEFELVETSSGPWGVGPVDALGLVEPVGGLSESVVVAVGDGPDRGLAPISSSRSVNRTDVS